MPYPIKETIVLLCNSNEIFQREQKTAQVCILKTNNNSEPTQRLTNMPLITG